MYPAKHRLSKALHTPGDWVIKGQSAQHANGLMLHLDNPHPHRWSVCTYHDHRRFSIGTLSIKDPLTTTSFCQAIDRYWGPTSWADMGHLSRFLAHRLDLDGGSWTAKSGHNVFSNQQGRVVETEPMVSISSVLFPLFGWLHPSNDTQDLLLERPKFLFLQAPDSRHALLQAIERLQTLDPAFLSRF